jgi:hypothetical protein
MTFASDAFLSLQKVQTLFTLFATNKTTDICGSLRRRPTSGALNLARAADNLSRPVLARNDIEFELLFPFAASRARVGLRARLRLQSFMTFRGNRL